MATEENLFLLRRDRSRFAERQGPRIQNDRHFTVEFLVQGKDGRMVSHQTDTMGRWILWQPVVVEVYDNRLLPLASREYTFTYRMPEQAEGLTLTTLVRYHILTDGQHEMLRTKYGLTAGDPYRFTIYERAFPLSNELAAALGVNGIGVALMPSKMSPVTEPPTSDFPRIKRIGASVKALS